MRYMRRLRGVIISWARLCTIKKAYELTKVRALLPGLTLIEDEAPEEAGALYT
jgi:hypothetical protein